MGGGPIQDWETNASRRPRPHVGGALDQRRRVTGVLGSDL